MLNKILLIFVSYLFSVFSGVTLAYAKEFQVDEYKVSVSIPEGWQGLRGYLGRDITLLGKENSGKRETIFIEVTEAKRIDLETEKKAGASFKKIKLEWLKKKAGKLNRFNLDKKLSFIKRDYLYHELSYDLNNESFIEGDLFLKCSSSVGVNLSYLILVKKQLTFEKKLQNIIKSLKCEKK